MLSALCFSGPLRRHWRALEQITRRMGAFWGIALSVLLWDVWHLKAPAAFVRRFFAGLIAALVYHVRGRVWGPMVGHPLGNRINAIQWLFRSRWLHVG